MRRLFEANDLSCPCPLCEMRSPPTGLISTAHIMSPFHILSVCTHPTMVVARKTVVATIPALLVRILAALESGRKRDDEAARDAIAATSTSISTGSTDPLHTRPSPDWLSNSLAPALTRLLLVRPWAQHTAPTAQSRHECVNLLGRAFDASTADGATLRRLAEVWVPWSVEQAKALLAAWRSIYDRVALL